jgi:hypothetical protein
LGEYDDQLDKESLGWLDSDLLGFHAYSYEDGDVLAL